jgi:hypothetical protein
MYSVHKIVKAKSTQPQTANPQPASNEKAVVISE